MSKINLIRDTNLQIELLRSVVKSNFAVFQTFYLLVGHPVNLLKTLHLQGAKTVTYFEK